MKRKFQKLLSIVLVLILIFSVLSVGVSADVGDYFFYETESNDSIHGFNYIDNDYTLYGELSYGDADYFQFTLTETSQILVSCASKFDVLSMGIWDYSGENEIAVSISTGLNESGTWGYFTLTTLPAGTYFLVLSNIDKDTFWNEYAYYIIWATASDSETHTHSYTAFITYPSCISEGYITYYCACGDSYTSDYTPKTGHTLSSADDDTCDICGAKKTNLYGWQLESGKWVYYQDGFKVTQTWKCDSQGWCYLGADGYMVTNGWVKDTKGWCYMDANGRITKNKWILDGDGWYFVDAEGYMLSNCWKSDSHGWCYLGANGRMVTNDWAKDSNGWCYLDKNGRMVKDTWLKDGKDWYFINADGYMLSNCWKADNKGWCYLGSDGKMAVNKWVHDGKDWYYVDTSGHCVTNNWVKDSNGWCYLGADGRMTVNKWVKDSQGWCYVGANGYCVTNKWMKDSIGWCYLDDNGRMLKNGWAQDSNGNYFWLGSNGYILTNQWVDDGSGWSYVDGSGVSICNCWKYLGGKWYYFNGAGYMVTNTWEQDNNGWCYLGSDGAMVNGAWADCDYCQHNFENPTYVDPATCEHCGAESGEPEALPLTIVGEEPHLSWWRNYTAMKIENVHYEVIEKGNDILIKLYFDAEKVYDSSGSFSSFSIGAKFKLYDEEGYIIDDATYSKSGLRVDEGVRGEYVLLSLDSWNGADLLSLEIHNYT